MISGAVPANGTRLLGYLGLPSVAPFTRLDPGEGDTYWPDVPA